MVIETIGRQLKESADEIFVRSENDTYIFPRTIEPFETDVKIAPRNYALLKDGDTVRHAVSMIQRLNGNTFENAVKKSFKKGLSVPTPRLFMSHYKNVNDSLSENSVLYDASGNLISGRRLENYVDKLNYDSWVWLNAYFEEGDGFLDLDLVTITGITEKGEFIKSSEPLEDCLEGNYVLADLDSLNSQGLPTRKSPLKSYESGKTVYFWKPEQDGIASFRAAVRGRDSGLSLSLVREPSVGSDRLGVFNVAEGTPKKFII